MTRRTDERVWGGILACTGGLLLALDRGYSLGWAPRAQAIGYGVVGSLFLIGCFLDRGRQWRWLLPALLCGAQATGAGLQPGPIGGAGMPFWTTVGLLLAIAFVLLPGQRRWAFVPAYGSIVATMVSLVVCSMPPTTGAPLATITLVWIVAPATTGVILLAAL